MKKCKLCKDKYQHLACDNRNKINYTICWNCLIELDLNHKDITKYET